MTGDHAARLTPHGSLVGRGEIGPHREVVLKMVATNEAGFGHCTNHQECEAVCPKKISVEIRR